ncbi:MAG: hypothetical protein L0Y73_02970 [Candidatus Aminicenantes bacterium]|nr:hypothetical protein [Candidatus Aminicenantes bacterium]
MKLNKISAEVSQESESQVVQHVKDCLALLPFLVQLSKEERSRLGKFSRKNQAFVERGLMYAKSNPDFIPAGITVQEFEKDVNLINSLRRLYTEANTLSDKLKHTLILTESEAYRTARLFYRSVKSLTAEGGEGAESVAKDLAYHYKDQGAGKAADAEKKGDKEVEKEAGESKVPA